MKATFNITKLWNSKPKHTHHKHKTISATHSKTQTVKENWDMSPEDALRVSYTSYK